MDNKFYSIDEIISNYHSDHSGPLRFVFDTGRKEITTLIEFQFYPSMFGLNFLVLKVDSDLNLGLSHIFLDHYIALLGQIQQRSESLNSKEFTDNE